jgi:NAD(P)-dependent dehydrogenase (short-subunit alcohol dehydrogenase family)
MEQLAGQVAVVTGAGSGIGRGIAAAGSHVMVADIDAAAAHETAAQLAGTGVEVDAARAISIDKRDARWVFEVNLMGAWYGCSAFGGRFTEQGTPTHILTGSENSVSD